MKTDGSAKKKNAGTKDMPKPTARVPWFEDCGVATMQEAVESQLLFFGKEELEGLNCVVVMTDKHVANQGACPENRTMTQFRRGGRRANGVSDMVLPRKRTISATP